MLEAPPCEYCKKFEYSYFKERLRTAASRHEMD